LTSFSTGCLGLAVDNRENSGRTGHDVGVSVQTRPSSGVPVASSPPARRTVAATWRDPRLFVGLLIVAVSVLLGARLLATADDTVSVWAVRTDLPRGSGLSQDDLEVHEVRFADAGHADRYLPAGSPLPARATLLRDVGAGELLPRAALGGAGAAGLVEVPVAVAAEAVPATVRAGSVVDVWVTPEADAGGQPTATLLFDDVVVVAAPRTGSALGPSVTRQVIIGVDAGQEEALGDAFARASTGAIVITKQG
jgi:hypothetical protein